MSASLRRKLADTLGAPSLLLVLTAGGLAYGVASSVVHDAYDRNLLHLAQVTAHTLHHVDGRLVASRILTDQDSRVIQSTDIQTQTYFRVDDSAGQPLAGDLNLPPPEPMQASDPYSALQTYSPRPYSGSRPPAREFFNAQHEGANVRAVRLYQDIGPHSYFITVAETLEKRRDAMGHLMAGFLCAVLLAGAAAGIAVRFGIPSALAPLRSLADTIVARSGSDLSPIDLKSVPMEVRDVVAALNDLFERLRHASLSQRHFLQDAAHQLRTPLASLQVELEMLQLAQTAHTPDNDAAAIERVRQSVRRLSRLTHQLLSMARAENGQHVLIHATAVNLADIIDELLDDWLNRADAHHIDLGLERDRISLQGDPLLLRELIANLMDNALKYTPAHGVITLRCHAENGWLTLSITDSGPGIPATARESVFERFFRLPDAPASGSGLGLPIAREIVHAHQGSIALADNPDGCGTRVYVRLPLHLEGANMTHSV